MIDLWQMLIIWNESYGYQTMHKFFFSSAIFSPLGMLRTGMLSEISPRASQSLIAGALRAGYSTERLELSSAFFAYSYCIFAVLFM